MISELVRKWFGLDPRHCESCEILREQLYKSDEERKELLHRILDKDKVEPSVPTSEEPRAITPQFTPWRVRQQMLEAEDHKAFVTMKNREKEIAELEKELGVVQENKDGNAPAVS